MPPPNKKEPIYLSDFTFLRGKILIFGKYALVLHDNEKLYKHGKV